MYNFLVGRNLFMGAMCVNTTHALLFFGQKQWTHYDQTQMKKKNNHMKNNIKKIIKEIIEKSSLIIILGTNAHLAAISVAAIRVVGGLAAIFLMRKVPRS